MSRPSPTRRVLAFLALVLALGAQPQVLCGLHCLFAHPMTSMDHHGAGPYGEGHLADAPGPALCHGAIVTAGHVPATGRLAAAWIPAEVAPPLLDAPSERTHPATPLLPSSRDGAPDRPPPRA